jgi:hypothetical protein
MADLINDLASRCAINPEMAKKGMGTLLGALKHGMSGENFAKVEAAIPDAKEMMTDARVEGEQPSGGLVAGIKEWASKLFGRGEGPSALAAHFTEMGFSPEQFGRFVPQAVEALKDRLPPDVMEKVSAMLPHEQAAAQ